MNAPDPELEPQAVIELRQAAIGPDAMTGAAQLEDVNWTVSPGDWWVVGGLHWSGKSALLATAGGLQRCMSGSQLLFGESLEALSEEELVEHRVRVGFVFENGGRLFDTMTVAENIALPICYHRNCAHGEAVGQVEALLELVGATAIAGRTPDCVSRSWRQRVGLARALALQPDVLMLDNPLAGLPPRERAWWVELLERIHSGEALPGGRLTTLVATTNDLHPWADHGRQFLMAHNRRCHVVGGRDALNRSTEPVVRELFSLGEASWR